MRKEKAARRALAYIERNLDGELDWEKIARALNYSKFYVARSFKEYTGETLHRYIQNRRLDRAAERLLRTQQPIIEIALEAGYGSQQAFTQAFRAVYGRTPQGYRKQGEEMAA